MRRGNKNQWSRRGERLRLASFLFAYWCSERDLYQQLFANSFHIGLQLGTFHSPGIFHNAHCWFVLFFLCPECCFLEVLQPLICSPFFLPCKPKITSAKQKKTKKQPSWIRLLQLWESMSQGRWWRWQLLKTDELSLVLTDAAAFPNLVWNKLLLSLSSTGEDHGNELNSGRTVARVCVVWGVVKGFTEHLKGLRKKKSNNTFLHCSPKKKDFPLFKSCQFTSQHTSWKHCAFFNVLQHFFKK